MEFKVGDRVRYIDDGDTGTITGIDGGWLNVSFEQDGNCSVLKEEVELDPVTVDDLADAVRKFAGSEPAVSQEEIQEVRTLGEQLGISSFEQSVRRHTDRIAGVLVEKNKSYGDSALNPVRIFSKADRMEQLYIRLDDKISRVKSGHEYPGDDTIQDIIGYCVLILIARESA